MEMMNGTGSGAGMVDPSERSSLDDLDSSYLDIDTTVLGFDDLDDDDEKREVAVAGTVEQQPISQSAFGHQARPPLQLTAHLAHTTTVTATAATTGTATLPADRLGVQSSHIDPPSTVTAPPTSSSTDDTSDAAATTRATQAHSDASSSRSSMLAAPVPVAGRHKDGRKDSVHDKCAPPLTLPLLGKKARTN